MVLGIGGGLRAAARPLSLAHGRRTVRDLEGAFGIGGAPRCAHIRGARSDPVRHLHRNRVGGYGRPRRDVSGGDDEIPARGPMVESRGRDCRRRARLGRGGTSRRCSWPPRSAGRLWGRSCRALESQNLTGASAEHEGSDFLTAKTTAMVCWLFIGSALFSAVFALHGGQWLIERWVLSMNLSPLGFQFIAQMIIFLLGWPLEWTEIIVIFCPIFIPLLSHFKSTRFCSAPWSRSICKRLSVAAGGDVGLLSERRFAATCDAQPNFRRDDALHGYSLLVPRVMYIWPGMTLWLPEFLYGN